MSQGKEIVSQSADITSEIAPVKINRADITKYFCPKANDKEVGMALAIVKSLNLNPFTREVHFIKYSDKDKMQIVVGYEVYLKRAERSGKLDGWTAGINTEENFAWVKIWRKDWREPFEWTVNLDEFNKKQSTWNQIPSFMGRKVAIAQGFRLCFPDETGGLPYTQEEHQVYDIDSEPVPVSKKPEVAMPTPKNGEHKQEPGTQDSAPDELSPTEEPTISVPQQRRLYAIAKEAGFTEERFKVWLSTHYEVNHTNEIPVVIYDDIVEHARQGDRDE